MPFFNGTGPAGRGPGTGRGRGGCRTGMGNRYAVRRVSRGRYGWFSGLAVSFVTMVVRDVLNPSGLLRGSVRQWLRGRRFEASNSSSSEAQYTVEDTNRVEIQKEDSEHQ